eukprot:395360-Pyramimonas_sp.AAC.1
MDRCHHNSLILSRLPPSRARKNLHSLPAPAHKRASASGERGVSRHQEHQKNEPIARPGLEVPPDEANDALLFCRGS